MSNADTWVIVRCFNEEPVVGAVVSELRRHFPNVVGIDDGSVDRSSEVMRDAGASVVRHAINLGAGAALQTGLQFALLDHSAQFFLCFDGDGQHRVSDAVQMVERMRTEELDVLIGSRFLTPEGSANMSSGRRITVQAGRVFERFASGVRLTDAHNGLRVFSRRFAERVDLTLSDMAYASELSALIARSGFPYAEHPVQVSYSEYSRAKGQRSINAVNIAMDVWLNQMLRGRRR